VQFGFIYGFAFFGAIAIWLILNVMHEQGVEMHSVCSVLGYGLVPIVVLAAINVVCKEKTNKHQTSNELVMICHACEAGF
jgi:hypothetical protein